MSSQRWIPVMAVLVAGACIGAGVADAGVISKVGGGGTVTLSLFQLVGGSYVDVTDTYLPTWTPTANAALRTVYVVVNGGTGPSLVAPTTTAPTLSIPNPYLAAQTTSAYPGNCTNYGTDPGPDFSFSTTGVTIATGVTGYPLTSNDCGGMAVILVGTDRFVVPKDADVAGNPTGIPDALDVFGVALTPEGDPDGDGLSTFDETVRGFIIGGHQKRLNPTVRDLFGFLVKGQCGTSLLTTGALPLPSGADPGPLDANLRSLIPAPATVPPGIEPTQIHFLANSLTLGSAPAIRTDEWVDHFVGFSLGSSGTTETWTYCTSILGPTGSCAANNTIVVTPANGALAPADDRAVNTNRVYGGQQRGVRVTECATTSGTTPQGTSRLGNIATGKDEAVVYTDRIRRFVNSNGSKSADIYYSTFVGAGWTPLTTRQSGFVGSGTNARNFVTFKAIQYILATEVGHDGGLCCDLTSPTFPHYSAGTGDNMDEAMRAVTSGSPTGVKFYIPSVFNNVGQSTVQISAPQPPPIP